MAPAFLIHPPYGSATTPNHVPAVSSRTNDRPTPLERASSGERAAGAADKSASRFGKDSLSGRPTIPPNSGCDSDMSRFHFGRGGGGGGIVSCPPFTKQQSDLHGLVFQAPRAQAWLSTGGGGTRASVACEAQHLLASFVCISASLMCNLQIVQLLRGVK